MRFTGIKYPGDGFYHVICDVCGKNIYRKDAVLITDKYNTLNSMLVCKQDADRTNPQAYPIYPQERPAPKITRPRTPDQYIIQTTTDRLPSAPRDLVAAVSPLDSTVELKWTGPDDSGSDSIDGYLIVRAEPQLSYEFTLIANTGSEFPYYVDTTGSITSQYTYRVAAINSFGTGPFSNIAFFPAEIEVTDVVFIVESQTNYVITAGDGSSIAIGDLS